jgi:hypothetical protein
MAGLAEFEAKARIEFIGSTLPLSRQHCEEETVRSGASRRETNTSGRTLASFDDRETVLCEQTTSRRILNRIFLLPVRISRQKGVDTIFVLFDQEGARGIKQTPSGLHKF